MTWNRDADGGSMLSDATACRELWGEVLIRGMDDAHGRIESGAHGGRAVIMRQAQAWIGSDDFIQVCSNAGLEPSMVERAYRAGRFINPISMNGRREA